ncbi:helix-turn-helix domain-containing protein [Paractinoplanes lichenicola]|uniref:Helix-turn-helix transcriptional regulator n=1 Tax=Paractinoplanes lichenicola TaxID=2802976 RepID=A0ABS1W182_9ACTN|nr:helix-turn-helix domain-containing protein [Actinoplanes lichenicola]MBL7260457.1 helix-turn-helix transcriptional regulator [Actinoplanes lichenicola]
MRSPDLADDMAIGRRVAYWRGRRKMSQQVFADRLGKSKSWVDKVERGVRRIDKLSVVYDIADVLQVDVQLLLGKDVERRPEAQSGIDDIALEEIREALERYDQMSAFFERPSHSPPLPELRKAVSHAWLTYQHAKYRMLARTLPTLMRDAQAADSAYASGAKAKEAAHLLGQVYQITSSVLRKAGEHELSWLAADRSIAVSQRADDQLLAGLASYRVGDALLALGRAHPALNVNVDTANRLASGNQNRRRERLSIYGMLLVNGAIAAARIGESTTVRDLIAGAEEATRELGGDQNHYWAGFGPTNVQLHRASTAVELGDGGNAVEYHERLDQAGFAALPSDERARHYLTIARGYMQMGDSEKAGEMLLEGDRLAPSEIRCRPLAHEVLSDVLRRTRGTPPAPIAELAEQMGV